METTGLGILSLLIFLPLMGAIVLMTVPEAYTAALRWLGMAFAGVTFGVSVAVLGAFQSDSYHFQMVEFIPWLGSLGIHYKLGIDGISLWMVMLTTFLTVVSMWFSFYVKERVKAFYILLLVLEFAMLGVFLSLDMVLFYAFFEASLVPMYFLIAIWGGAGRAKAAVKFFIFTFTASLFLLVGMIWMANLHQQATGVFTFDLASIQSQVANGEFWVGAMQFQSILFWMFTLAFMVKCPMFPFHTWLPDAHTEAPTAGSILLAGVLLKMGTYGFLRFSLPLFPDVLPYKVPIMMGLAVAGILWGSVVAAMQSDLKRLVAYSSVAHMGFAVFGIFSLTHEGLVGGAYVQIAHGVSTGALFLLVGLIYERTHSRMFKDYGGLKAQMPIFAALFMIIMLSSLGLPGLNGFVGEFLALLGGFRTAFAQQYGLNVLFSILAAAGTILAAVYLLWMFQKVFYGPLTNPALKRLKDLKTHEMILVGMLVVLAVWGGIYPNTFLKPMERALGATRHMAVNPPGLRPTWTDLSLEVDSQGNLVRVPPRRVNGDLGFTTVIEQVAPANFHFPEPGTPAVAARVGGR